MRSPAVRSFGLQNLVLSEDSKMSEVLRVAAFSMLSTLHRLCRDGKLLLMLPTKLKLIRVVGHWVRRYAKITR